MNKQEFLAQLRKGLCGLPQGDVEECLTFYSEMLDDKIEEGFSEEEAVSQAGPIDEIVEQAVGDTSLAKIAKERIKSKRHLKVWEIVLLALGSPVWLSLGIAAVSVILALYISLWAVIVSLWAVIVSLAICAVAGVPICIVFAARGIIVPGLVMLAAGIVCAALSILMFFGCREAARGILILTKRITMQIKNLFIGKERA